LIGSYVAALWIGLCAWPLLARAEVKAVKVGLALMAVWLGWLAWIYKERPEFTPVPHPHKGWSHERQLLNSLEGLFDPTLYFLPLKHSPLAAIAATLRGDAAYGMRDGSGGGPFALLVTATLLALVALLAFAWRRLRVGKARRA
jgi:hypothetical protein